MMHADGAILNDLSEHVIDCAFTVLNTLGVGCLEKVDESALANETRPAGPTSCGDVASGCTTMTWWSRTCF
jgi:hypothetical protein